MDEELLRKAKQKKRKRNATVLIVVVALVAIFGGMQITGKGGTLNLGGSNTCTLEIRCDSLSEDLSALEEAQLEAYVPSDGVILSETEYSFEEGATVYDALNDLCKANDIHLDAKYDASYQSYYIKGINHLYEFDGGKRSGWLFTVNGTQPDYGAGKVELSKGDKIVWFYTVDYTKEAQ